jgi:AcrR family transcriptional regulator
LERRRGKSLEGAILDAGWDELSEVGYSGFTLESVAKRSGTSRPVLARRWASRADLAVAAIAHYLQHHPVQIPDFGNVRDDLIAILERTSRRSFPVNTVLFSLRDYFAEAGTSLAEIRSRLTPGAGSVDGLQLVLQRGIERGEIDSRKLTSRIASLPLDLVRHETLMMNRAPSKSAVAEMVDTIFLPLVKLE